jgi:hypothetical protein
MSELRVQLSTKGEAEVVFKGIMAAATAVALVAAPTVASAQAAAKPVAATQVAPAVEDVDGSELRGRRGGFIIPLIAVVLVILAIIIIVKDDDESPVTP